VRLSVKRAAGRSSKPRVSTGNPGERSGEISVWMLFLGKALAVVRFASKKELSSDVVSIAQPVRN
jgi:hypothetical protein